MLFCTIQTLISWFISFHILENLITVWQNNLGIFFHMSFILFGCSSWYFPWNIPLSPLGYDSWVIFECFFTLFALFLWLMHGNSVRSSWDDSGYSFAWSSPLILWFYLIMHGNSFIPCTFTSFFMTSLMSFTYLVLEWSNSIFVFMITSMGTFLSFFH